MPEGIVNNDSYLTVMTVDDDPSMLEIVSKYLSKQGIRVVSTTDPESVVPMAERGKPRLIISDIAMPGLDGLTLLKKLKENQKTSNIPLVLLTSSRTADDINDGIASGAEACLVKPVDWNTAWPKLQKII